MPDSPQNQLNVEEVDFIHHGLEQWGGPAHPSDAFARDIGFSGVSDLHAHVARPRAAGFAWFDHDKVALTTHS